jgi:hypothetical protein
MFHHSSQGHSSGLAAQAGPRPLPSLAARPPSTGAANPGRIPARRPAVFFAQTASGFCHVSQSDLWIVSHLYLCHVFVNCFFIFIYHVRICIHTMSHISGFVPCLTIGFVNCLIFYLCNALHIMICAMPHNKICELSHICIRAMSYIHISFLFDHNWIFGISHLHLNYNILN